MSRGLKKSNDVIIRVSKTTYLDGYNGNDVWEFGEVRLTAWRMDRKAAERRLERLKALGYKDAVIEEV